MLQARQLLHPDVLKVLFRKADDRVQSHDPRPRLHAWVVS